MPARIVRLPSHFEQTRLRHQPSGGIARYRPGIEAEALGQIGKAVQDTTSLVDEYADKTAELHARDALVQLKRRQNQMIVGEDGYSRILNGAATQPGVVQKYQELHKNAVGDFGSKLSSRARGKFDRYAQEQSAQFQAGLLTHIMKQDLNHRGAVYKAQIATAAETMAINAHNPDALLRERVEIDRTVAQYIQEQGITDQSLQERMLQEARGIGHRGVIDAYLEAGEAQNAQAYFEAIRQEMLPEQAKHVAKQIEPAVADLMGREIATELFTMHAQGASELEIQQRKQQLTEGKTPAVTGMVDKHYGDQIRALEADRNRMSGGVLMRAFHNEPGSGLSDPELREIRKVDPELAFRVSRNIEAMQKQRAAEQRARAEGGTAKTPLNMELYGEVTGKIHSGEMDRDELLQYLHLFPDTVGKSLLRMADSVADKADKAAAAAGKFRIPTSFVRTHVPPSVRKANGSIDPEKFATYSGFIDERTQEWKDNNPGKIPGFEDQKAIMRSANEEYVEVGRIWNSTIPAYQAEGREYAIPAKWLPGFNARGLNRDEMKEAYAFIQSTKDSLGADSRKFKDEHYLKLWDNEAERRKNLR